MPLEGEGSGGLVTASHWQLELPVKHHDGHNFLLQGSYWENGYLVSSGLTVFAGLCGSHIRTVQTPMMRSRPGKRSVIQSCFFESKTNQVEKRGDLPKLIKLEFEKERLPQIPTKYRGSFIFAFSVTFSFLRYFSLRQL